MKTVYQKYSPRFFTNYRKLNRITDRLRFFSDSVESSAIRRFAAISKNKTPSPQRLLIKARAS